MYKLLTPEGAKKVAKEYSLRRASAVLGLALALALFAAASLLPSLILLRGRRDAALLMRDSALRLSSDAERRELESWADGMKQKIALLSEKERSEGPYGYFQMVLDAKPSAVKVTGLSYDRSGGTPVVRVRGVALDRQTLLLFESNLSDSGDWEKTDFPVDALAKDKDVEFELSLIPKEQNE